MSGEASVVVKGIDQLSAPMKKMSSVTKAFSKDVDALKEDLYQLTQEKAQIKLDMKQANMQLKEAEKRFISTRSEVDRLSYVFAQVQLDDVTREFKTLNKEISATDKEISKVENRANGTGGIFSAIKGLGTKAMWSQLGQMGAQAAEQYANYAVSSAFGEDGGSIFSSALSGMASGASIGVLGGTPVSVAIGAGIGLATGIADGLTKTYEKKDDFFKDYYNNLYEERISAGEAALTAGSTTAGSREQSYKAFEKRLGTADADTYLSQVKSMAAQTNYGYDEILGYSKLLLNSYDPDETFGLLTALSDATAGLGLNSSDVEMFIKGLSRMRTTGKVTQEYLNYFSERGVDVYEALARGTGADKSKIADMVTRGKIKGTDAAQAIVDFLNETYGGLSKELMDTYDAKVANLKDVQTNVEEGYGTGYNETRKPVVQAMTDTLDGKLGENLTWLNQVTGSAQGYADNLKDTYWMDIMEAVFAGDKDSLTAFYESDIYDDETKDKVAQYRGDYLIARSQYLDAQKSHDVDGMNRAALEMDRIRKQSEVLVGEVFGSSDFNKALVDSQTDLMTETRNLADIFGAWVEQYGLNQEGTKGGAAGGTDSRHYVTEGGETRYWNDNWGPNPYANAWGLDRVPYDNYPALLHQGERVLTAQQAREADRGSGVSVVISGNEFHIREDADVDRVAEALLQKLELAAVRG